MWRHADDLHERAAQLQKQAEHVMRELQAQGQGWEVAWRDHPVAIAYRQLLKDAWAMPADKKP